MRERLDRFLGFTAMGTAIGLVVLTLGTGAVLVSEDLRANLGLMSAEVLHQGYRPGDSLALGTTTPLTSRHVVIFARSTCGACEAARPVLKRIVDAAVTRRVPVTLVVPAEPDPAELNYASSIGLPRDRVIGRRVSDVRIRTVPAIVTTDDTGRIVFSKEGDLSEADADTVIGLMPNLR